MATDPTVAELTELRTKLAIAERLVEQQAEALVKVAAFCAQRAEYVDNLRDCNADHDYYGWTGHAEARRQLSELLGLPVGWPAEDKVEVGASDGR